MSTTDPSPSVDVVSRSTGERKSLEEAHRSVRTSHVSWFRRLFAFAGPAYMVSVGYMDPGNWATDIEGGASFGYTLIWVLLMSNLMAVLLQTLSARLGLVTGRDLAQACRDAYNPLVRWVLFFLCEIAIAACDLAEVLGTAIGLSLLTGHIFGTPIPLVWAVLITGLDVFLLLAIQRLGIRKMEAFILTLVMVIGICFIVEIFLSKPSLSGIAGGFVPTWLSGAQLYVAIGILGATVMPHNLYLHSSLVQTRDVHRSVEGVAQACRYNFIDSAVALNCAFFVNAAILIVSAATFWSRGIEVSEIQQAHQLLDNVLGTSLAPIAFALALLCAGQSSTVTGTLAGQITMEGFLRLRVRPWLRRLITRSIAIVPAVIVISSAGEQATYHLLIFSQVILSLQLPFAVVPLVKFTSSKTKMGPFASPAWVMVLAWLASTVIIALNVKLVGEEIMGWYDAAGPYRVLVLVTLVPAAAGLLGLLFWMMFRREDRTRVDAEISATDILARVAVEGKAMRRIGVALEARNTDAAPLAEALALCRQHKAELVLMHVVEGVGGQWYGHNTNDQESRSDEKYLADLAAQLRLQAPEDEPARVRAVLGYGDVVRELVRLADQEQLDLLVTGGHGHKWLGDLVRGQTIPGVRHALRIPVMAVRGSA